MKTVNPSYRLLLAAVLLAALPFFTCFAGGMSRHATLSKTADSVLHDEIRRQVADDGLQRQLYFPRSVSRFYTAAGFGPVWIKPQSGEGPAWQALLMIDCVLQYGLSHADYHPQELTYDRLHNILDTPDRVSVALEARYDIMLTDAILTLMNHLHFGKLNPDFPAGKIDAMTVGGFQATQALSAGLRSQKVLEAIDNVQPKAREYINMQRRLHMLEGIYQDDCYEVPQAEVRKIAINMERLRWVNLDDSVYIHINIPSYTLKLYLKDSTHRFKVIVGKPGTPTPTLLSAIRYFTSAPEWRVPAKIFRKELLPKALADSNYLEQNHYAIYDGQGKYVTPGRATLSLVSKHPERYSARQSAGCDNALGLVVYRFPNVYDVYLHDTPEQKLFSRENRDLSHGCIRVEHAEKLGTLLLKNDGSADKIATLYQGIAAYVTRNIYLKKAIPVKITYLTCEVNAGEYVAYKDIYDLDKSLEMALYGAALQSTMQQ